MCYCEEYSNQEWAVLLLPDATTNTITAMNLGDSNEIAFETENNAGYSAQYLAEAMPAMFAYEVDGQGVTRLYVNKTWGEAFTVTVNSSAIGTADVPEGDYIRLFGNRKRRKH